jgi:hypothetical protein
MHLMVSMLTVYVHGYNVNKYAKIQCAGAKVQKVHWKRSSAIYWLNKQYFLLRLFPLTSGQRVSVIRAKRHFHGIGADPLAHRGVAPARLGNEMVDRLMGARDTAAPTAVSTCWPGHSRACGRGRLHLQPTRSSPHQRRLEAVIASPLSRGNQSVGIPKPQPSSISRPSLSTARDQSMNDAMKSFPSPSVRILAVISSYPASIRGTFRASR